MSEEKYTKGGEDCPRDVTELKLQNQIAYDQALLEKICGLNKAVYGPIQKQLDKIENFDSDKISQIQEFFDKYLKGEGEGLEKLLDIVDIDKRLIACEKTHERLDERSERNVKDIAALTDAVKELESRKDEVGVSEEDVKESVQKAKDELYKALCDEKKEERKQEVDFHKSRIEFLNSFACPVDPAPVDPAPVDPAPVDPALVDPAPVDVDPFA